MTDNEPSVFDDPNYAGPEWPKGAKWTGPGYRGEYSCAHGVGHGNHTHGCDGCCARKDFPLRGKPSDGP